MNDKLKIKQYTLSPQDNLPRDISDVKELIKKVTRKITINATGSNLNKLFPWVELAEKTLKRYKDYDDKLIINLQRSLANMMCEKMEYNRAKSLIKSVINKYLEIGKINKKKLAEYYWYLAIVLHDMGFHHNSKYYDDAKKNIEKALSLDKNNPNNHGIYADILFRLGENTEAENHYKKKVLEICINKKGKEHQQTAAFYNEYGVFLTSLGKYDKAKNFLTKAYRIFKNKNGEENLYTVRCLCHLYHLDYCKKDYNGAFAKVNKAFLIVKKIKGDNDKETELNKNNCGRMLVMLKQYNEAADYLSSPFVIVSGKEKLFLLLDYNKDYMPAPQIIICKKGVFAGKLIKIAKSKNIPIIKNHVLAKGLMKDCGQFVSVLPVYYKPLAKILTKIIKVEE